MGSFLLAAGTKGKRYCLPNARVMLHQPAGGIQGKAADIEIHAREILEIRARLNKIYADCTGQSLEVIEKSMDRDNFMSADESKKFGLVDEVILTRPESPEVKKVLRFDKKNHFIFFVNHFLVVPCDSTVREESYLKGPAPHSGKH